MSRDSMLCNSTFILLPIYLGTLGVLFFVFFAFNTLKNQGYQLEHNYGHGESHLATNFAYLTFLAFLVDQIQELACPQFQKALHKPAKPTRKRLWKKITSLFLTLMIDSWDALFKAIADGSKALKLEFDTS